LRRNRAPRPKPPTELPLDDGAREGTDPWREIDGVRFCHWDRWLLRLALDEADGLCSIQRELRRRTTSSHHRDSVSEALLAQVTDLESRMRAPGLSPGEILDQVERQSTWLYKKAFRRVWHATSIRRTGAMERTPRKVLESRALAGNWTAFPISPAPYFAELRSVVGDGWYDHRATGLVVTLLDLAGERLLRSARTDDERLAIRRAALSAAIAAMGRVDDSLDELGQHFRERELAYLGLLRAYLDRPGVLRDLLELAIWEDYGLFREVEPFLRSLSEPHADLALRDLARLIAELGTAGLEHQLDKARRLRRAVIAVANTLRDGPDGDGLDM
jgi:hypothetical protein